MKITKFESLLKAVEKFGVNLDEKITLNFVSKDVFKHKNYIQINNLEEVLPPENGSEIIIVTEDGKILRTVLYIPNDKKTAFYSKYIDELNRFHIYRCGTINTQKLQNRWHQSISKTGKFIYNFSDKTIRDQELQLCSRCLKIFEKEQKKPTFFSNIHKNREFNLADFLSSEPFLELYENENIDIEQEYFFIFGDGKFDLSFVDFDYQSLPKEIQDKFKKKNKYVKEWHQISRNYRKLKNWTCEDCGWKPKTEYGKRFIHSHHINKNTQENQNKNLKAVCIECHLKQPNHNHMKNLPDFLEFRKNKENF
jgi:hypothetical protein